MPAVEQVEVGSGSPGAGTLSGTGRIVSQSTLYSKYPTYLKRAGSRKVTVRPAQLADGALPGRCATPQELQGENDASAADQELHPSEVTHVGAWIFGQQDHIAWVANP